MPIISNDVVKHVYGTHAKKKVINPKRNFEQLQIVSWFDFEIAFIGNYYMNVGSFWKPFARLPKEGTFCEPWESYHFTMNNR